MITNKIQISLKVSVDCYNAILFLRSKKIKANELLRQGGEQLVIQTAQKNKFKLVKYKIPF